MTALIQTLVGIVGERYVSTDPDVLEGRVVDHTGRYRGHASALVRPGSAAEVAAVLKSCAQVGHPVTIQGGRTSLVAGTVPEHADVLLSTERLTDIGSVDLDDRRIRCGAGVTLAALQRAASEAGLLFGVDIGSRDSATVGGMASTNAGGLRTVQYGNMGEQVLGVEVALPDGSIMVRRSDVRADNTGYDLTGLFVGAEGTLGVITALDLRLHPIPAHRVAAISGFDTLQALVDASRIFRDLSGIAALELIDARATALTAEHLGVQTPVAGNWLLLVELARADDPTEDLADALTEAEVADDAAVGLDSSSRERLWQVRESIAEVLGIYGPPLKFDVALPLAHIGEFERRATSLIADVAPEAIPVLFGHIGEGNLHLNVLRCPDESRLYEPMMNLIADLGGNVSSEHGVGTRKRAYLGMARDEADIAAMRTVKAAFDPSGYLNPAVLFEN